MSNTDNDSTETSAYIPMQTEEAINIIQLLIDGIHPLSDSPLADNHLCRHSDIQRALQTAIPALESKIKADKHRANLPANAGSPWSNEEDARLADAFDNGDTIATLVETHQRTRGSINSRLMKLGKITG